MKIIESIMTKNPCYKTGRKITVKGLMLHSVGCPQPSAPVFVHSWDDASFNSACVHAFIDANDGTIYQTLPWNHRGWHGGGSSNNTHIGVEMCEPNCIKYTGGSSFTCSNVEKAKEMAKRTYEAAVDLFAYLCKEFNLDPLADGVIISHKEGHKRGIASNHGDPEHLWNGLGMGYTMNTFRQAVKAAMVGNSAGKETATATTKKDTKIDSVLEVQTWLNNNYASGLTRDGLYGSRTKAALVKALQKELGFTGYDVDGIFGKKTRAAVKNLSRGDESDLVKVLQGLLVCNGYKGAYVDGDFGSGTESAVIAYQRRKGLDNDGIAGKETFTSLCA